jgi:prepilin-type N-terminal cleavage/methylation domain-containing protein
LYNNKGGKMKKRGFTIVELLVVIMLIGFLTGMTVFSYRSVFKRSKLEEAVNEVRAFYEGVNKKAVTEGYKYTIQINRDEDFLKYISTETSRNDSLVLREGLDLDFTGGANPIELTVYVDGFVRDNDGVRDFVVIDEETGKYIDFYISPLGVMEAQIK